MWPEQRVLCRVLCEAWSAFEDNLENLSEEFRFEPMNCRPQPRSLRRLSGCSPHHFKGNKNVWCLFLLGKHYSHLVDFTENQDE